MFQNHFVIYHYIKQVILSTFLVLSYKNFIDRLIILGFPAKLFLTQDKLGSKNNVTFFNVRCSSNVYVLIILTDKN